MALSGGVDAQGMPAARDTVFDPSANSFVSGTTSLSGQGPQVAASEPAAGASDVPVDGRLVLRLATPLRVDPATEHTITLAGPQGPEAARVVFAEDGRLVFITPAVPLTPGARYTLTLNGAEDHTGLLVPFTAIDFTTARLAAPPTTTAVAADRPAPHDHSAHAGDADEHSHLPKVRPQLGGPAELDEATWRGERDADGKPRSRWQKLPPLRARSGVTALAGQVLRLNGEPLAQVTLAIGGAETRTDHTGRFLLPGIPTTGRQGLLIDGSTANTRGRTYGSFFPGVDIAAGTTTVLPWTVWMPLIDMAHAVPLPVPTAAPMVVTSPRIPGLEVHIPGNVILQTSEGPLTVVALTRLSVEQPPFPVPDGATFLWTPQTHGALVAILGRMKRTPTGLGVPSGRTSGLARFVSEDPIGLLAGDTNFYAYVGNSPLSFVDSLGLDRCECATSGTALGGVANFSAGFGDILTSGLGLTYAFGLPSGTEAIRTLWMETPGLPTSGAPDVVDPKCSWAYTSGQVVGVADAIAIAGVGAVRGVQPGGFLNANRYLRIGFGRHGGDRVFRMGGKWVERITGRPHIDFWRGGPL